MAVDPRGVQFYSATFLHFDVDSTSMEQGDPPAPRDSTPPSRPLPRQGLPAARAFRRTPPLLGNACGAYVRTLLTKLEDRLDDDAVRECVYEPGDILDAAEGYADHHAQQASGVAGHM